MPSTITTAAEKTPARPPRIRQGLLLAAAALLVGAAVVMAPAVLRTLDDPAGSAPVTGVDVVEIRDDRFGPPVLEVPVGARVTWRFEDGGVAHNVVGERWESEVMTSGSFVHTFDAPGTYPYTCTLHWGMDGRVEVVLP